MKGDKLVLINRLWKCKKSERLTITANSFSKIHELDGFRPLGAADGKIPPAQGTNQIARFLEFRPLTLAL